MTESSARDFRPGMDLDEFERRLRSPAPAKAGEDPLAELARLVGQQDDPFRNVFAQEHPLRARPPAPPATLAPPVELPQEQQAARPPALDEDDFFQELTAGQAQSPLAPGQGATVHPFPASRAEDSGFGRPDAAGHLSEAAGDQETDSHETAGYSQPVEAFDYDLRPPAQDFDAPLREGLPFETPEPAFADARPEDDSRAYDPVLADPGYMPDGGEGAETPRKSRRLLMVAGLGALAVAALGVGYFGLGSPGIGSGEAPTILAQTTPAKVEPPAQAERPVPASSVLEQAGASIPAQTNVVTRQEQPVDLAAQAQLAANANGESRPAASPFPEPKRVRTVSVRPDGTIIAANEMERSLLPPAEGAVPDVPPMMGGPAASGATPAPAPVASAPPRIIPTTPPPDAPAAEPAAAEAEPPKATVRATPASRPAPAPAAAPARPAQLASAPATAADVRNGSPAATAAIPAPAATASTGGGFAVQLAAPNTDAAARQAMNGFRQRYADLLGGKTLTVRKATVSGRDVYRVRVGDLSREEATTLCSQLQASGGNCFVARN